MKAPFLIGRMLMGGFFLYNGIHHFLNRKPMVKYAESKGIPAACQTDQTMFMNNVALAGTVVVLMGVDEPWEGSVPVTRPTTMDKARKMGRKLAA